jgi:diacylglycerol kinase family enzyme
MERRGLEARVIWDSGERSAMLRDAQRLRSCRCVVAAGGDGTVADVINELPAGIPLAALPAGNENLFARQFGFPVRGERLARAILAGRVRRIDLGRAGGRLFSLMLSVGFDAEVVHRIASWRVSGSSLRRVNRLSYAKPIVDSLRSYSYSPLELEADGVRVRGTHALVFNLPQYGFQLPFAADASGEDGMLDWLVFERPGTIALADYLWSLVRSKHRSRPDVRHGRARHVRITGRGPLPIQVDGEAAGVIPVEIEVVPQALTVVVPV